MVDALKEAWRVLVPHGTLLDLRPCSGRYPIEVVSARTAHRIGKFEGYGMKPVDALADRAVREFVEQGLLIPCHQSRFSVWNYWDDVDEIEPFLNDERRIRGVTPPLGKLERTYRELVRKISDSCRLRYRSPVMLAAYHKPGTR